MARYRVLAGEGNTIREALEQIRADLARELDMTFLGIIVIGRAAAGNLEDLLYFARSERVPITSFVAVARGTTDEVLHANAPGFSVPAEFAQYGFTGAWTRNPAVMRFSTGRCSTGITTRRFRTRSPRRGPPTSTG